MEKITTKRAPPNLKKTRFRNQKTQRNVRRVLEEMRADLERSKSELMSTINESTIQPGSVHVVCQSVRDAIDNIDNVLTTRN